MFFLSRDRELGLRALSKLRDRLDLPCGRIATFDLGTASLSWFSARPSDNFHVYSDGFVVGKRVPGEPRSLNPIVHSEPAPSEIHPLVSATRIQLRDKTVHVQPFHTTNVFHDGRSASDMQLLIADAHSYRPSADGVALLSAVGYFPGSLSLFSEIRRIPLFSAFELGTSREVKVGRFRNEAPDDAAMVDRLVSLLPAQVPAQLAVSGGCDSRFVLGLLHRAGIRPSLIRLSDGEDDIAAQLAAEVGLPLTIVRRPAPDLDPETYTLRTDAQIYHRGGHYGRLRDDVASGALYYTGLFADSIVKNAFRAAWKVPHRRRDLLGRLIEHALLSQMPSREAGLARAVSKPDMRRLLGDRLSDTFTDVPFERSKARAAWFYFVHRGLRWTPANLADLSFHAEPVLPLSDIRALELGLRSSAWSNFHNDRVRSMTHRLLPQVRVGYANEQRARVSGWPRRDLEKIAYEYGSRAMAYWRGRSRNRVGGSKAAAPPPGASERNGFRSYFDRSLEDVLSDGKCSRSMQRAAITLNSALAYLDSGVSASVLADSVAPDTVVGRQGLAR